MCIIAEHCNRSANLRQSLDSTEARCSSCVSSTCRCPKNSAAQTSASASASASGWCHSYSFGSGYAKLLYSCIQTYFFVSDISSERSWDRNHYADSKLVCQEPIIDTL